MRGLLQDLRYAFRVLAQAPGFTATAVLTLALGIGANSAIFSVVNALLLRSLPYPEAGRLVAVDDTNPTLGFPRFSSSLPNYADWKAQNGSFEDLCVMADDDFNLTDGGEPERLLGMRISQNLLPALRVRPVLGRPFTPEEDRPGAAPVALIGYGLWQRRFGGSPGILGRSLVLSGRNATVVGVLPPEFYAPSAFAAGVRPDILVPLATDYNKWDRGDHEFIVVGRLKPGATVQSAQSDLNVVTRRLERSYPASNNGWGVILTPLRDELVAGVRRSVLVLLGAVGFVLLIACVNVANLLLVRAASRQKEIAVRAALGAGRMRIVRQLLTESLLLAVCAGLLGLVVASAGAAWLSRLDALELPRFNQVRIDPAVLGFTFALALLTGVVFGLAPALHAAGRKGGAELNEYLKESGRSASHGRRGRRLRSALVVSEIALALTLMVGAGLMLRSLMRLLDVEPGFRVDHLETAQVSLPNARYPSGAKRVAFYDEVLRRVRVLPGVQVAAWVNGLPLQGVPTWSFKVAGRTYPPGQEPNADARIATPAYLAAMGIPLLAGRNFTDADTAESARVVLVNQTLARRMWPGEDPVGKLVTRWSEPAPFRVIGVVGDTRYAGLERKSGLELYFSLRQFPPGTATLAIRTAIPPSALASAVRAAVWAVDKNQPVTDVQTMEQVMDASVSSRRFQVLVLAAFAGLALLLAAIGIYGVISYSVAQRRQEIGIRIALGAAAGAVQRMIVREAMLLAAAGVALGLAAALALTRVLGGLLYGISATDPSTFGAIAGLLLLIALAACYVPARGAARVDPATALHCE
jgi:putative ABC transport system permease protein